MTDRYAVLGNPIGHSKSPRIHALFAKQTGQDISYEAILAPVDGFADTIRSFIAAKGGPARGANVTVPFKEEAFRLATRRTARAEAAGAVNTLSFGRRILLLGAGGAARGVILPLLLENPAELLIANRTEETAAHLALEFARLPGCAVTVKPDGTGFPGLAGRRFDLVINATSAGLSNAVLPLPTSVFAPRCVAYEMVYGRETAFMAQARDAGARTADCRNSGTTKRPDRMFGSPT